VPAIGVGSIGATRGGATGGGRVRGGADGGATASGGVGARGTSAAGLTAGGGATGEAALNGVLKRGGTGAPGRSGVNDRGRIASEARNGVTGCDGVAGVGNATAEAPSAALTNGSSTNATGAASASDSITARGVIRGCGLGVATERSPGGATNNTAPQTAQRARTPCTGTLAGSTRNTERHSPQVTFTSAPPSWPTAGW